MEDKHVSENEWVVDVQFVYHKCCLLEIPARFKAEIRLNTTDGVIAETRDALGEEQPASSTGGVTGSILP